MTHPAKKEEGMKYRVKYKAIAICVMQIDIKNESNPYDEASSIGDNLKENDFTIDTVSVVDLKPIT